MPDKINTSPKIKILLVYAVLTVVTLAVYGQVHQFNFVNFDDNVYVTENHHIQSGITRDSVRWAFNEHGRNYAGLWTPLLWLSFMLDYEFYGLNAGGYHLTNLMLHIMSTLLLFWLFNRMTGAVWKSAFVAAFFALHPLHVESVAWVTERKDVLSAFFWMLTLCLYVRYAEKPDVKKYLLVLFAFGMALMSKPMVITLPGVMILLDYWPLGRFKSGVGKALRWQFMEKAPFFILSAVAYFVIITSPQPDWERYPFYSRLMNGPVALINYLGKTFWPHDMAVFYPFPAHIPLWQVSGASALLILITIFVIVTAKRMPYLFAGWMWFSLTIFPVSGMVYQIWLCAMTDRYHYLPSIGIAVMLAWGAGSLFSGEAARRRILFPAGIIFLALLSWITWKQCGYWKNSYVLFSHALRVTENNFLAHNNLGLALASRGKYDDAIRQYHQALGIKPDHLQSLNNRGNAYLAIRDYRNALGDYNKVISINPNIADTYYNRGLVYTSLGLNLQAIADYHKSVSLNPDFANAYNNRAFVYVRLGDYRCALEDYNEVLRLNRGHADALNNRAFVHLQTGNIGAGCDDAQRACAMGVCLTLKAYQKRGYCN